MVVGLLLCVAAQAFAFGDGDKLHPNRLGYLAMGMTIDLDLLTPAQPPR